MSEAVVRALIVAAVVLGPAGAVALARRRPTRRATAAGLPTGLSLFTAAGCRWCGPALDALRDHGADVNVIAAPDPLFDAMRIRSVTTAVVVGNGGSIVMRRSGPVVASDAAALAEAAKRRVQRDQVRRGLGRSG